MMADVHSHSTATGEGAAQVVPDGMTVADGQALASDGLRSTITALLWVDRAANAWNETIAALLKMKQVGKIYVAFSAHQDPSSIRKRDARVVILDEVGLLEAVRVALADASDLVLFVTWPCRPSPDALDLAAGWMIDDPRIGTMSFLSNSAGSFSFPHRNTGTLGVDGHDEVSLTKSLRSAMKPDSRPAPVQLPDGAMVLVGRSMLDVCGDFDDYEAGNLSLALVDMALRGGKRGFNSFLDPFTFVTVPWDNVGAYQSVLTNPDARHAIFLRHPHFPIGYDLERTRSNSVLAQVLDGARSRTMGIRVLIDGSALGPKEMGTQVCITQLSAALADCKEIQYVVLGVPNPAALPLYAQELRLHPKIQLISAGSLDFPNAPQVDIIHRPYQPSSPIPWDRWREISKRSVITVQDLIAYRNVSYFATPEEWISYRDNFHQQVAHVDAVFNISHDVVSVITDERLPIDASRVYVIENGTDALNKEKPTRIPDAVLERGWAGRPFLFVLGATYAHKNRDLAIRVWAQLREKGYPHKLILAGPTVPHGSTRIEESLLDSPELAEHILNLPDVDADERNWLLRFSRLVVYLTSAEGFGLVPFEAASLDVPSLYVSFGPLRELIEDPNLPRTYEVAGLVARAEALLTNADIARASIAGVLKNVHQLTWAEAARKTVDAYFDILSQPSRRFGA